MPKRKITEQVVNTPFKKIKSNDNSSLQSSEGSSDQDIAVADNRNLIVSVTEAETTVSKKKVILLSISNARPNTALGTAQGDHVTAYKSFLEMLTVAVEGKKVRKSSKVIVEVAKSILPNKAKKFDEVLKNLEEEINAVVSREKRREIIEDLKNVKNSEGKNKYGDKELGRVEEVLKASRRHVFMTVLQKVGQKFIEEINLDEETAFKKEGKVDKTEGTRVKIATHALKAISGLKTIYDLRDCDENIEPQINRFYKNCIKIGAPYRDGANAIFGRDKVGRLDNIWKDTSDKKAFLVRFYSDVNKEKTASITSEIAGFIGNLFDFKHDVHGTKTDARKLLYKVIAKHIVIMFRAFDEFKSFSEEDKNSIIDQFLSDEVLNNQGWLNSNIRQGKKFFKLDLKSLKNGIKECANLSEFRMLSDEEIETNNKQSNKNLDEVRGRK